MKLLLVHGWGFDPSIWNLIQQALDVETDYVDFGYFGEPHVPAVSAPVLAIGHSFGLLWLLRHLPPKCIGLVSVNGFDRFAGDAADPVITPYRVLDRMIARFEQAPDAVLGDFRKRCGCDDLPPSALNPSRLAHDLHALRDHDERASVASLAVPLLALEGEADPLLSSTMRAAAFAKAPSLERHELAGHGHLLPLTAPGWCAAHIQDFLARLTSQ